MSNLFWLAWGDPRRPEGEQFLGAAIIPGQNERVARDRARQLGINPGGQCQIMQIPAEAAKMIPAVWRDRFLTLEDCVDFDQEFGGDGSMQRMQKG